MITTKRYIPEAYRQSTVPAHRTRDQIETLLLKYGADGVAWQSAVSEGLRAMALQFIFWGRNYRLQVHLGETPQDERQRLRALFHHVKATLEQHTFGLLHIEDMLLAYQVVHTPEGRTATVGEVIQPQLAGQQPPSLEAGLRALPARTE